MLMEVGANRAMLKLTPTDADKNAGNVGFPKPSNGRVFADIS